MAQTVAPNVVKQQGGGKGGGVMSAVGGALTMGVGLATSNPALMLSGAAKTAGSLLGVPEMAQLADAFTPGQGGASGAGGAGMGAGVGGGGLVDSLSSGAGAATGGAANAIPLSPYALHPYPTPGFPPTTRPNPMAQYNASMPYFTGGR